MRFRCACGSDLNIKDRQTSEGNISELYECESCGSVGGWEWKDRGAGLEPKEDIWGDVVET